MSLPTFQGFQTRDTPIYNAAVTSAIVYSKYTLVPPTLSSTFIGEQEHAPVSRRRKRDAIQKDAILFGEVHVVLHMHVSGLISPVI